MKDVLETFEEKVKAFIDSHATNRRMNINISKKLLDFVLSTPIKTVNNKFIFTYEAWDQLDKFQYIKERRQEFTIL